MFMCLSVCLRGIVDHLQVSVCEPGLRRKAHFCHDKHVFCHDKHVFVATKTLEAATASDTGLTLPAFMTFLH